MPKENVRTFHHVKEVRFPLKKETQLEAVCIFGGKAPWNVLQVTRTAIVNIVITPAHIIRNLTNLFNLKTCAMRFPVWQHPFVSLFKHCDIDKWSKAQKAGDVTELMVIRHYNHVLVALNNYVFSRSVILLLG